MNKTTLLNQARKFIADRAGMIRLKVVVIQPGEPPPEIEDKRVLYFQLTNDEFPPDTNREEVDPLAGQLNPSAEKHNPLRP